MHADENSYVITHHLYLTRSDIGAAVGAAERAFKLSACHTLLHAGRIPFEIPKSKINPKFQLVSRVHSALLGRTLLAKDAEAQTRSAPMHDNRLSCFGEDCWFKYS